MSITPLADRAITSDTDGMLDVVIPVIDNSGIVRTLQSAGKPRSPAGAPPRLGSYTARGVLIAMFHVAYAGLPASVPELCALIWRGYTDAQMKRIGMSSLRDAQRLAQMTAHPATFRSECQRLRDFINTLLAPMDDTALPANRRATRSAGALARSNAEVQKATQRALRRKVVNDLIAATLDLTLLGSWKGDIAIDEHVVHISTGRGKYFEPRTGRQSATPLAMLYPKQNRVGIGFSVGLTRAVATSRPRERRVPTVCVSLDINTSSSGSTAAALNCLDEIARGSVRPKPASGDRPYLVTDMGYTREYNFNADVLERGYTLLMNYPAKAQKKAAKEPREEGPESPMKLKDKEIVGWASKDLAVTVDPEAEEKGPWLHYGVLLCPAAQKRIAQPALSRPSRITTTVLREGGYAAQEADYDKFEMPLKGLPVVTLDRGQGRPASGSEGNAKRVVAIRVSCPAAAGKVACPIRGKDKYLAAVEKGLPRVGDTAPIDNPPKVCRTESSVIKLSPALFRAYQPIRETSWEHEDWMSCNRSRDEGFNSILTSKEGGNLQDRSLYARRNPALSLTIAFAVARANLKIQDSWRRTLTSNSGLAPFEPRAHLETRRGAPEA